MSSAPRWLGWLPWRRSTLAPDAGAPAGATTKRVSFRARGQTRGAPGSAGADPTLRLAREWLHAHGARLAKAVPDGVAGILPDGTAMRYTNSLLRARQDPQATLVAPGTTGLDSLLSDIERRGADLVLRVDALPGRAETLAREAFVGSPGVDAVTHVAGRFVVVGSGKGVREAVLERRFEVRTLEYAVRMSVVSPFGRREELIRLALDPTTGEPRRPLDEAVLRQARAASGHARVSHGQDTALQMLEQIEGLLDPKARAAARLARAHALPEYQRRQDDIQALYARLLQETPEQGAVLLEARERELSRLAESRAIDVRLHMVNVATVISDLARVRLGFAGGGEVAVDVDPCRGHVLDPRCPACDAAWQAGARCGEGHITCLNCQQVCAHCGARRCSQCARAAFAACPTCGQPACTGCARRAARGRHRLGETHVQVDPGSGFEPASAPRDEPASREDLTVADLDAMTDATWRACLAWLLAGWGYTVDPALDWPAHSFALICRRAALAPASGPARFGDIVVVAAYRADVLGSSPPADLMREVLDLTRRLSGARGLIVTTAPGDQFAGQLRSAGQLTPSALESITILGRDALTGLLAAASGAYGRERHQAQLESDRRAAAAQSVRAMLIEGASGAASALERLLNAEARSGERRERESSAPGSDATRALERAATTVRQALAALETLVEEWEACFAPAPTRDGTLSLVAEHEAFARLSDRAEHLTQALTAACSGLASVNAGTSSLIGSWHSAVAEELQLRCLALERRLDAVDPSAWRSFSAAHDAHAARAAVDALAASGRAALRARRLSDEVESRRPGAASHQPGVQPRSSH